MRIIILAVLLAMGTLIPQEVDAGQTKARQIGCRSAASYDEVLKAVAAKDHDWYRQLQAAGRCMILKPGLKAQIIDCSWGVCQYRVWTESGSLILWMAREAVRN